MILILNCGSQSIKWKVFDKDLKVVKEGSRAVFDQETFQRFLEEDLNKISFKRGAAYIAIKGGINITPVFISTSEPVLRKDFSWYEVPSIKPIFKVTIADEIEVESKVRMDGDLILESEALTEYLEELYLHELS